MFSSKLVTKIHKEIIKNTGGSYGIRNKEALEGSLKIPFQTFDNKELYPSIEEKAAKLLESIIKNHPFVDGNKRTGYVLLKIFLEEHNREIKASEKEKYEFIMDIAKGKISYQNIVKWIKEHTE